MYTGPGSGPMLAAAAAWDGLAAELHSSAASYSAVLSGLTAGWQGPSSAAMAAAAEPYTAWMSATAVQAEQTAEQARAAAAAYETAFAATVPPPVIAANRALLMSLIATNILGQNTPAIAATEADYAEMWAQDATAMYGYAGSSAAAAQLTPFNEPPQTTKADGTAVQVATVPQAAGTQVQNLALTQALQSTAAPAAAAPAQAVNPPISPAQTLATLATSFLNATIGPYDPSKVFSPFGSFYDLGVQSFLAPFNNYKMQVAYGQALSGVASGAGGAVPSMAGAAGPAIPLAGPASGAVSASMGRAGVVGSLSVPQGWASAAPAIRPVAVVLPEASPTTAAAALAADGQGGLFSNMALSGAAGRAMAGTGGAVGRSIGGATGASPGAASTATIIVIPED